MRVDMLPGDEVVMALEREGRYSLLTDKGSVSAWLWIITRGQGVKAVLHAILPSNGGAHRGTTLEVVFPVGDLASVHHWLQDNDTAYALCHGLDCKELERIKKLLRADLAEMVRMKAGELGQRPGIVAGMPIAAAGLKPIPLVAAPAKTEIFNAGEYREVRVS